MSEWVPFRDDFLLFSSALQRQGIKTAALPFGFAVYPTFFDSEVLECEDDCRLVGVPEAQPPTGGYQKKLAKAINAAVEKYPDVRFAVDFVLQPSQSATNPAFGLVSHSGLLDENWVERMCVDPLDDRVLAFADTVDRSATDFSTFTTDHHWTLERALRSYNRIAESWQLSPAEWLPDKEVLVSSSWFGSYTREGLDAAYASKLVDQADDFSALTFRTLEGLEEQGPERCGLRDSYIESGADGQLAHNRFTSLYMDYYGEANSDIANAGPNNGRTCLLVGDSFSLCLKRYIAANYERTICILPGNEPTSRRLTGYIKHYDVDDVIVMMHPRKAVFIDKQSPKFMDVGKG